MFSFLSSKSYEKLVNMSFTVFQINPAFLESRSATQQAPTKPAHKHLVPGPPMHGRRRRVVALQHPVGPPGRKHNHARNFSIFDEFILIIGGYL